MQTQPPLPLQIAPIDETILPQTQEEAQQEQIQAYYQMGIRVGHNKFRKRDFICGFIFAMLGFVL